MPVFTHGDAEVFHIHGSRFSSYVRPASGGRELCAWRLDVPAQTVGLAHRPDHEEVLLVLAGRLTVTLDQVRSDLVSGDVLLVGARSELQIDTGTDSASAWVTTTPGLTATTRDGEVITPPWAN